MSTVFFALLQLGTVMALAEGVSKILFRDGSKSEVVLQKNEQKYEAIFQPLLPVPALGNIPFLSGEYAQPAGFHLMTTDGNDLGGRLIVEINALPLKIVADAHTQPESFVFYCTDKKYHSLTTTINVKFPPELASEPMATAREVQAQASSLPTGLLMLPPPVWQIVTITGLASAVVTATCFVLLGSFRKAKGGRHNTRIESDDKALDKSAIFDLVSKTGAAVQELKILTVSLGNQLREHDQSIKEQLQRLTELVSDSTIPLEFAETVREAKKETIESLYSEVNRAFGDSLAEIWDWIKKEIREDFNKQLSDLTSLMAARGQVREASEGNGSGEDRPHPGLKRFISEQANTVEVEKAIRVILASPAPNNDGLDLTFLARKFRDVALAVEEIERRFRSSNMNVPKLGAEIRFRLLRLVWLAQKYHDLRRDKSFPVSVEINAGNDGLERFSLNLAKAIETSLQYWHAPKQFLEASLDQIISRDLLGLVKICDSAGKDGLFDDVVRKLLDVVHLEDISPRSGDRYDPSTHLVLDYESGNRDTVIRLMTRGFRYKHQILSKPTVVVGR